MSSPEDRFKEFAQEHNGPLQNRYQLYREDVEPCWWYLSVNGHEAQPISAGELGTQLRFRNWHFLHGHNPPLSVSRQDFERMIGRLYDAAIKREKPLPFLQTDAGHVETLTVYFDGQIPNMVRAKGEEFLKGKVGDFVRIKIDEQRIYFKWKQLGSFSKRVFHMKEKDVDILKRFISKRGGYQDDTGVGGWFRNTYWIPLGLFEEPARVWLNGGEIEGE